MVTGVRGLCQGLGPALFGLIFYLFNVDLEMEEPADFLPPRVPKPRPAFRPHPNHPSIPYATTLTTKAPFAHVTEVAHYHQKPRSHVGKCSELF